MRRGEVYFVDLEPVWGSEANRARPVVIVSHDALNTVVERLQRGVLTVVPLTSKVERVLAFQVYLPAEATGLPRDSKARAEQVRALTFERFAPEAVGVLSEGYLRQIEEALRLHLALE